MNSSRLGSHVLAVIAQRVSPLTSAAANRIGSLLTAVAAGMRAGASAWRNLRLRIAMMFAIVPVDDELPFSCTLD